MLPEVDYVLSGLSLKRYYAESPLAADRVGILRQAVCVRRSMWNPADLPGQIGICGKESMDCGTGSFGDKWFFFYAQARIRKFAAKAACGPRGGQGENLPCSIAHGYYQKEPETEVLCRRYEWMI